MKQRFDPLAWKTQFGLNFDDELNVDLFAGGGGASTGVEMALNRPVDIAINHDPDAVSLHTVNHPNADHFVSDVYEVDPVEATGGRPVGHLHASPDCTDHSQAKGGQSRKRATRSLSWVVHLWAGKVRPRVITLENVEQILHWSPLVAKRCKHTGRVITLELVECPATGRKVYRVAEPGECIPVDNQFLVPDQRRRGRNWEHFVTGLREMGYTVQWKTLKACDYGAPTTRERLYLVARCDGQPIVWPQRTHTAKPEKGLKPYRTAADCIDWSIPGRSIFDRPKPLAENTLRRIAKGIDRYVLNAAQPFIVPIANYGSGNVVQPIDQPLRTVTAWPKGGTFAVATAFMAQMNGGFNTTPGHDLRKPTSTITNTGSQQQLITAHLTTLRRNGHGRSMNDPVPTLTAGGEHHALVQCKTAAFISRQFGASVGQAIDQPAPTITAGGGGKTALVECRLSPDDEESALRVAGFLMHYYSTGGQWGALNKPLGTVTTKDRLALVTVYIRGTPYVIVDIHLRMLQPRELFKAQGFPESYIIDRGHDGRVFTKSTQVRFVGNSVSPLPMAAIVRANHQFQAAGMECAS